MVGVGDVGIGRGRKFLREYTCKGTKYIYAKALKSCQMKMYQ